MANEFIIKNGFHSKGNSEITGSLTVSTSITASGNISASAFIGDGSELTNLQRPITTHTTSPISSSITNANRYHIVGGNMTCSIANFTGQIAPIGAEFEFFQTSSAGNFLFETGSGITVISKNDNLKLSGLGSAATLKKVASTTFHLVGDLTS